MRLPSKSELLQELIDILDDPDTSDEEALSALKTLKKYDKILATDKAMQMYMLGVKRVPVRDILLSLLPEEKKKGMELIPKDMWKEG